MLVEVPAPPWITSTTNCPLQFAGDQVVAGTHDCRGLRGVDHTELGVGLRGRLLHERQRAHEFGHGRDGLPRDRKVVDGAGRVNAPVRREGNVLLAEEVVLAAGRGSAHGRPFLRARVLTGETGRHARTHSLRETIVWTRVSSCALIGRSRLTPEGSLHILQRELRGREIRRGADVGQRQAGVVAGLQQVGHDQPEDQRDQRRGDEATERLGRTHGRPTSRRPCARCPRPGPRTPVARSPSRSGSRPLAAVAFFIRRPTLKSLTRTPVSVARGHDTSMNSGGTLGATQFPRQC